MGEAVIPFELSIGKWDTSQNEAPEVNATTADIKIVIGNKVVTRNQNRWSKSTHDDVRLSAYPLALWFASSWWRLRWESIPTIGPKFSPNVSWKMAHEMLGAGHGYLWPRILFVSDSESIHVWAVSNPDSDVPIRYVENAHCIIPIDLFESEVKKFIQAVIARLDAVKITGTHLHDLWSEVKAEINDPALSTFRKHESLLGFEPDEAPEKISLQIQELSEKIGEGVISEIAPVCSGTKEIEVTLNALISFANAEGIRGKIDYTLNVNGFENSTPPWERGWSLARTFRKHVGLNEEPISSKSLSDFIGMSEESAFAPQTGKHLIGVATRNGDPNKLMFHFRTKELRSSRRFEIARYVCDYLISDKSEKWLPITDTKTVRQKIQRSFAVELLCPLESLVEYLGEDFTEDDIEEAGKYFEVSTRAIKSHLVNNKYLPRDVLSDFDYDFSFPYSKVIA